MASMIPNSTSINRGGYKIKELHEFAIEKKFSELVLIHEYRGVPNGLIISHLPVGPTLYLGLHNTIMRHDVTEKNENVSLAYPHLIFHNFNDKIGERIKTILMNLFPIPLN